MNFLIDLDRFKINQQIIQIFIEVRLKPYSLKLWEKKLELSEI